MHWKHQILFGFASLALAGGAHPAGAQDGVIVAGRFLSGVRNPGEDLGPAPPELSWPLAGGGRFAARDNEIRDLRTNQARRLAPGDLIVAVDPRRPRLFVRRSGPPAAIGTYDIPTGAFRPLLAIAAGEVWSPAHVRYASGADLLAVDRAGTDISPSVPVSHAIQVIDATTGALRGPGFTVAAPAPMDWIVTPEGDRAYVGGVYVFGRGPLTMVNLQSGQQREFAGVTRPLLWDELNERLIAQGETAMALTRDLVPLAEAYLAHCAAMAASPHTGRVYIVEGSPYVAGDSTRFTVVDGATYQGLGGRSWRGLACDVTVLSAPGPPRRLRAVVAGHQVSLDWTAVGAASGFVLDVGFAPGRTDLQVYLGPEPHTAFAEVPSGTYYLRLRGGNEFGGGRPSQETQVQVP